MNDVKLHGSGATTYNPLLSQEEELRRWAFSSSRPKPENGQALVLIGEGRIQTILFSDHVRYSELRWGKYRAFYRVDVTEHWLTLDFDLSCATEGAGFQATVTMSCRVTDPQPIVTRQITDVSRPIEAHLRTAMEPISSLHEIEQRAEVQKQIQGKLSAPITVAGMTLESLQVKLSLDAESAAVAKLRREIEETRKTDLIRHTHDRQKVTHEQALQELSHAFDGQRRRTETALELELLQTRMDAYRPTVEKGSLEALVLQMAQNPEDIREIVQAIRNKDTELLMVKFKAWQTMMDRGAQEGWEMRGQAQTLMSDLFNAMGVGNAQIEGVSGGAALPEITSDPTNAEPDFNTLKDSNRAG